MAPWRYPQTHEVVTLCGHVQLRQQILKWGDHPGIFKWAQNATTRVPISEVQGLACAHQCWLCGWRKGARGNTALGKDKETTSHLESAERNVTLLTPLFFLAHWDSFWTSELQNCEKRKKFFLLLFQATKFMVICYSSHRKLMQASKLPSTLSCSCL